MKSGTEELSEKAKMNIKRSEKEIKEGKTISLSEVKKKLSLTRYI